MVFKDSKTGEIEQNESIIKDVMDTINHYNGINLIMDLLKHVIDFNLFENEPNSLEFSRSNNKDFENLNSFIISGFNLLYPKLIKMESNMIKPKTNWFYRRIMTWEKAIIETGIDKSKITFDMFSDYSFGALELFSFETAPKAIEKIMKMLH